MLLNGTNYAAGTRPEVASLLEHARVNRIRLVFEYQDDWKQTGYVGRSCGEIKVPLCISNSRSMGGEVICSELISRILTSKGKRVLYRGE